MLGVVRFILTPTLQCYQYLLHRTFSAAMPGKCRSNLSLARLPTGGMDATYFSGMNLLRYNALSKPGSSYYQTQGIKVNEEGTIAIVTSYVGMSGYNIPFFVGYISKDNLSSTSWSTVYKSGWDDCLQFCANSDYSHIFMMTRFGVFTFNNCDTWI